MTEDETLGLFIVQIGGRGYYVCEAVSEEIDRLKAIASKAIREQIPMREEIDALKAQLEPFRTFASAEVIHALREENARLREALRPFADLYDAGDGDDDCFPILNSDLRAARAAMGGD